LTVASIFYSLVTYYILAIFPTRARPQSDTGRILRLCLNLISIQQFLRGVCPNLFSEKGDEAINKKQVWYSNDNGFGPTLWPGRHSVGGNSQPSESFNKISGANHTAAKKSRLRAKLPGSQRRIPSGKSWHCWKVEKHLCTAIKSLRCVIGSTHA